MCNGREVHVCLCAQVGVVQLYAASGHDYMDYLVQAHTGSTIVMCICWCVWVCDFNAEIVSKHTAHVLASDRYNIIVMQ